MLTNMRHRFQNQGSTMGESHQDEPMVPNEQIAARALSEFQKVLRENLACQWEPRHGHPPTRGYIEQKAYCTEPYRSGRAERAWNITPDSIAPLDTVPGLPADCKIDGMFYDLLVGFFGISQDHSRVSINWQTGPRFGRGFVHLIERAPDGTFYLGRPQPTSVS